MVSNGQLDKSETCFSLYLHTCVYHFLCKHELIKRHRVRMRITNVCAFKMKYNFLYGFNFYHVGHFNLYLVRNAKKSVYMKNLFPSQV